MVEKNTKRGDAWRYTGVMGNFIDVHTCYMRLRHLVWDRPIDFDDPDWVADTANALLDLRNYTLLVELAMAHKLAIGEPVGPLLHKGADAPEKEVSDCGQAIADLG